MVLRKFLKFFFIIFIILLVVYVIFSKNSKIIQTVDDTPQVQEDINYNSNIIENVNYSNIDVDGNEYIINSLKGEIDYSNSNILFLTNVDAIIKLNNSDIITISSDFGKYNSENFDTIFSKNVLIKYLNNKITGEYLDFSFERNSMIISREVVYTNLKNILKADAIEMDIKTKNTKIFMYEKEKKVNVKSKN